MPMCVALFSRGGHLRRDDITDNWVIVYQVNFSFESSTILYYAFTICDFTFIFYACFNKFTNVLLVLLNNPVAY